MTQAAIALAATAWLFQWARMWIASGDPIWSWLFPPLLAAYLAWERWAEAPAPSPVTPRQLPQPPSPETRGSLGRSGGDELRRPSWVVITVAGALGLGLALLALPWLEPFPGWPLAEWVEAGGLALLILALLAATSGPKAARHWTPVLIFALAALPWPTFITNGALGALREGTASALAEIFTLFGLPAVADGTIVRIGSGTIGIEEACGGIRSLQFGVLLALAIGALRRDSGGRQTRLVAAAILLALAANALRLAALTAICGRAGIAAVERWHDPIAAAEFLVVLAGLAFLALRRAAPYAVVASHPAAAPAASSMFADRRRPRAGRRLCLATLLLLPAGEALVQLWFLRGDERAAAIIAWSATLPRSAPDYAALPWTATTQALLNCDRHQIASWRDHAGRLRAGYVVEWDRGQTAAYALAAHNPDVCLPLAGNRHAGAKRPVPVRLGAANIPFTAEPFTGRDGGFVLYYLAWNVTEGDPLTGATGSGPMLGLATRWREIARGRRRIAARTVAIAIFDAPDEPSADAQFREEFGKIAALPDRIHT